MNVALLDYPRVAGRIPPCSHGIAEVIHQTCSDIEAAAIAHRMDLPVAPGLSAALRISGEVFMSDLEYERKTCLELAHHARGRVLIAGLGLGMVLPPLFDDPDVESITVVEKIADVITLITPHYQHPKLTVLHADVFHWRPKAGSVFDTIYFDIWPLITLMNLVQMTYLHRAFAPYLNAGGWMESWMRQYLIARARRIAREPVDPYRELVTKCGGRDDNDTTPDAAAKLLGILRRLQSVKLAHARHVALAAGTRRSCGTDVLPNEAGVA